MMPDSEDTNNYPIRFNYAFINGKLQKQRSSSCKTSSARMLMINKLAESDKISKSIKISYDMDILESESSKNYDVDNVIRNEEDDNVTRNEEDEKCNDGNFIEINTNFANSNSSQEMDIINKNYVIRKGKISMY